jgi:hypothetical protein
LPVSKRAVWKLRMVEIMAMPERYMPWRFWRYSLRPAARVVP